MKFLRKKAFAALLVVCLLSAFAPDGGRILADDESDLEELQKQEQEIEEKEYEANQQLSEAQAKVDEVVFAIKTIDMRMTVTEERLRKANEKIDKNLAELEQTRKDLESAEENQKVWYEKLKYRLKVVYESGQVSYLEVLLKAGSMSELLSKAEYSRELAQYDDKILSNLADAREEVETKKGEIEEKEKELEQARLEQEETKEELQNDKEEKEKQLQKLEEDKEALELFTQQMREEREAIQAEIAVVSERIEAQRRAEEEARRKAEEEEARRRQAEEEEAARRRQEEEEAAQQEEEGEQEQPQEEPSYYDEEEEEEEEEYYEPYGGGSLLWPLPGYSHLSTYFMEGGHRGIDIPAPSGTPILAAAGGTVIKSQWNNSYGNYVAISHGNGLVTLYAHASALCCSVGDVVSAGETVALIGTTGNSTGNHLHFEVQLNGSLMNPLSYTSP